MNAIEGINIKADQDRCRVFVTRRKDGSGPLLQAARLEVANG